MVKSSIQETKLPRLVCFRPLRLDNRNQFNLVGTNVVTDAVRFFNVCLPSCSPCHQPWIMNSYQSTFVRCWAVLQGMFSLLICYNKCMKLWGLRPRDTGIRKSLYYYSHFRRTWDFVVLRWQASLSGWLVWDSVWESFRLSGHNSLAKSPLQDLQCFSAYTAKKKKKSKECSEGTSRACFQNVQGSNDYKCEWSFVTKNMLNFKDHFFFSLSPWDMQDMLPAWHK